MINGIMLYATPQIDDSLQADLETLDGYRKRLHSDTETISPWLGMLRKQLRANTVESSTSIEGFSVEPGVAELIVGDPDGASLDSESARDGLDHGTDDYLAVACYARATDHVGVMATDPSFEWNTRVVLDLHFDACSFQRKQSPGHWRTGSVRVTDGRGGIAFEAPDAGLVPKLMGEVCAVLAADRGEHPVVSAAMAHLNVVSLHPFRDGNGRVSRLVQSLVLARAGLLAPEFNSIEDYLARNTPAYYAALQKVQQGGFDPQASDATSWLRFCVSAHLEQAREHLGQIEEAAARWARLEGFATGRGWPDRLVIAMEQALRVGIGRHRYQHEAGDLSPSTLSGDFRRLVDAGLVHQEGKGPSTVYKASDLLRSIADGTD